MPTCGERGGESADDVIRYSAPISSAALLDAGGRHCASDSVGSGIRLAGITTRLVIKSALAPSVLEAQWDGGFQCPTSRGNGQARITFMHQ